MDQHTLNQLKNLISLSEQAIHNKERVYTVKELYKGVEIEVLTDRAGFLEYVLSEVQTTLIDEVVQQEEFKKLTEQ